ncbi:DUF1304 domain-containing protein [Sinorhizobium sp. BG8]|uniref:DUF1304 domain-containing protein n=1 Tax=Sinorhizobium sp. BG8 TaxID=2613773 RepID=UPI00193D8B44|nr:DUF1304 domain-containing protein [Sinorhizobium sp. BG8]QRM54568.1 DUF1304 domain-containing protein [Sinorhizobium sp. BG8]
MIALATVLVLLTAIIHTGFLFMEMFLWTSPLAMAAFGMDDVQAEESSFLAGRHGVYNGFLALGLIWGLLHPDPLFSFQLKLFFLLWAIVAACYGAWSVNRRILYVQGVPAILAFIFVAVTY